jgi:hypothetical protein
LKHCGQWHWLSIQRGHLMAQSGRVLAIRPWTLGRKSIHQMA